MSPLASFPRDLVMLMYSILPNSSDQSTKSEVPEDRASRNILMFTSSVAVILPFVIAGDKSKIGSNTSCNNGLVVSVIFAFACSLSDFLLVPRKPNAARIFRISAVMWLVMAFAFLFYALFLVYVFPRVG